MMRNLLIQLVPGTRFELVRPCGLRILSPLQGYFTSVAPRRIVAHGPIKTATCVISQDCIEAHNAHGIQAGSATQTATGKAAA